MSRILLLSDIHANLTALDAVLKDAAANGPIDETWSLGDAVGYGPRPNECLERLRELDAIAVAGNHELAAYGSIPATDFNQYARTAIEWTGSVLTSDSRDHIDAMLLTIMRNPFTLVHGSPRDPVWEYIMAHEEAAQCLKYIDTRHCVYGHTHVPIAIPASSSVMRETRPRPGQVVELGDERWFLNPGSVGQPRDGDPRASYAVIDSTEMTVSFFRTEYPVEETQHQMQEIGLPDMLIQRLEFGR